MLGGEIYVKRIPSMSIMDIAKAVSPNAITEIIGIRPGEKLHEQMIGQEDAPHTYEYSDYFKILPAIHNWSSDPNRIKTGRKVAPNFQYISNTNSEWMPVEELVNWIKQNLNPSNSLM